MSKLLLVEDDAIIASIYQRKLKSADFEVTHAADGEIAIEKLREDPPDIVLLDLQLPKKNGIDVLLYLRSQSSTRNVPAVVFTNAYLGQMVQAAWDAGATKCLTKAICTPKQVADVLRATLEGIDIGVGGKGQPPGGEPAKNFVAAPAKGSQPPPQESAPRSAPPAADTPDVIKMDSALADLLAATPSPQPSAPPPEPSPPAAPPGRAPRRPRMPQFTQVAPPVEPTIPSEEQFQAELRKEFTSSLPPSLAYVRQKLQAFVKNENDPSSLRWTEDRSAILFDMYRRMHSVTSGSGACGCLRISRVSAAFEALLTELSENPDKITDSTTRTIVSTVDFLGQLFEKADTPDTSDFSNVSIMVVDDEPLSRKAVMRGLEKAELTAKDVADPRVALELAEKQHFHLIFLDIDMPGMDGYELCKKIRATSTNNKTPVIFVTGLNDFMAKAKSSLSGGSDLIGKPFLSTELAVKSLSYLVKARF